MQKITMLVLAILAGVFLMVNISAADVTLQAKDFSENRGTATNAKGYVENLDKTDYIMFKDVDLSGINSLAAVGWSHMDSHSDADLFEVRIDSLTGPVVGLLEFNSKDGSSVDKTFQCSVEKTSGKHNLYFISTVGRFNSTGIKSITLSSSTYQKPVYKPADTNLLRDNYHDTWVAVDDLGRALPDYEEVGALKEDKIVGIFYWTWHAPFSKQGTTPMSNENFMKEHPEARFDYANKNWPTVPTTYFWDEPMFGYYSGEDYYVLRKQIQMLANAGVDVLFFDNTNGPFAWKMGYEALCNAMIDARNEGLKTPQIAFMSNFGAAESTDEIVKFLYRTVYKDGKYKDLWFMWEGKPLIMAYPEALRADANDEYTKALISEIREFFTFRRPQAAYKGGQRTENQWGWLEVYPQNKYVVKPDGSTEQVLVGTSANHSSVTDNITAMNDLYVMDRTYTNAYGQDLRDGAYKYGFYFDEQWKRALDIDPKFIFVTGWNEWTAGRFDTWGGIINAFPDQFNKKASRDIEPAKNDMKDNYYYQLAANIRKFKGVRPTPVASAPKTIAIGTDLAQWNDVGPAFINDRGVFNRSQKGYGGKLYTNVTARNNVIISKVARDNENLYFYAQTDKPLSAYTDKQWMRLYINVDRNKTTGWEGYDFIVNRVSPTDKANIDKNVGGFNWQNVGSLDFKVTSNVLEIKIPKSLLGLSGAVDIEFKWVDNTQQDGDIMDFWVNGNAAPMGRYNYRYTETLTNQSEPDDALIGTIAVKENSNRAFVNGGKTSIDGANPNVKTLKIGDMAYVPMQFIPNAIDSKIDWEPDKNSLTILTRARTVRAVVNDVNARADGKLVVLSRPIVMVDGMVYVPLSLFSEGFELGSYNVTGDVWAFGSDVNFAKVEEIKNKF